jgi:ATP phosphoribosyltransferase
MSTLRVAIPKGQSKEALELFRQKGIDAPDNLDESRKYIVPSSNGLIEFIVVKPVDVPIFVERGCSDVGIVGKDVLLENERKNIFELVDLGTFPSRIALLANDVRMIYENNKIATKYPNITLKYFRNIGQQIEIIKVSDYLELSPLLGLAERVVDKVERKTNLNDCSLVELETICHVTDRLICNRVSYIFKNEIIQRICDDLQGI